MARLAQDREDLLREATALVPRVMLRMPMCGATCEVFAGFRAGAASLYFGADPVYHFNSEGELRRAFVGDHVIKAAAGRLHVWQVERTTEEVAMQSRVLAPAAEQEFGAALVSRLAELRETLTRQEFELVGQVPADSQAVDQLQTWLAEWREFKVAAVANVK
jgi:hypothetical protein